MHNEERLKKRRNKNFVCEEEHTPLVEEEPALVKNVSDDMRKILCIDTGEVFNNAKEAGEWILFSFNTFIFFRLFGNISFLASERMLRIF